MSQTCKNVYRSSTGKQRGSTWNFLSVSSFQTPQCPHWSVWQSLLEDNTREPKTKYFAPDIRSLGARHGGQLPGHSQHCLPSNVGGCKRLQEQVERKHGCGLLLGLSRRIAGVETVFAGTDSVAPCCNNFIKSVNHHVSIKSGRRTALHRPYINTSHRCTRLPGCVFESSTPFALALVQLLYKFDVNVCRRCGNGKVCAYPGSPLTFPELGRTSLLEQLLLYEHLGKQKV